MTSTRSWWRSEAPWLAAFVPLTILYTWPLASHFATALAGDRGDHWQTLWGFTWIRKALSSFQNPFFTHDLWHPTGVTLVFQTFDLPDALWAAPLLGVLGPWPTFNLVMMAAYVLSGWTMYALSRRMGASAPASFFAGCAFTFSTYHFAHSLGHMHIVAMQWVPLFVLAWWRVLEDAGRRWAVAGGAFLALASLASWYHLFTCFLIALGILIAWIIRWRGRGLGPATGRILLLCLTYLIIVGPLAYAMLKIRQSEPISGEHQASFYSADVQTFFHPNAAQALSQFDGAFRHWSGNPAETATYLGYFLMFLVGLGLILGTPRIAAYLLVSVFGVVIALGPRLHWGGMLRTGDVLPYARLEHAFPLLQFMGVPVRFALAATFGLSAALAHSLDALARRLRWWVVAPFAVLAVAEHAPHAFTIWSYPTPPPMVEWAKDPSDFAVLDVCRDMRPLWHQTIHKHPIMSGSITRTPARLETAYDADPVAGPLSQWEPPTLRGPISATAINFPFDQPVAEGADPENFSFELQGELVVTKPGQTTFFLESDDAGALQIDHRMVIDNRGSHPKQEMQATIDLAVGVHPVTVKYQQYGGDAWLKAWWAPPGEDRRVLGGTDVRGGFNGNVSFRRRGIVVPRDQAFAHLHALHIRYVVQDTDDSRYIMETQLGLRPIFEGDDLRIYEVPKQ